MIMVHGNDQVLNLEKKKEKKKLNGEQHKGIA
jgi:hypothetical protein